MKLKTVCFKENDVHIIPIGDLHLGDKAFNKESEKKVKGYLEWVKKTPNARIFLLGDILNCATRESKSSPFEQNMDLKEQIKEAVKLFEPVKEKIIGAIDGNHESRISNYTGYSPTISLCERLGIDYLGDSAVIIFRLGKNGTKGSRASFSGFFHHSTGGGGSIGSKMNVADKLRKIICDADFYCLSGDTKILTKNNGIVKLSDIQIGDEILTKNGNFEKVLKTFKRKEQTYCLSTIGGFQDLYSTENHPFLSIKVNKKRSCKGTKFLVASKPSFKQLKDLKPGDFIAGQTYLENMKCKKKMLNLNIDEELCRFVGLYLAEGNLTENGIAFSFNKNEIEYQNFIKKIAKRFGENFTESYHPNSESYQIIINSKRLAKEFFCFGRNSHNKYIPQEYMALKNSFLQEIVRGIFEGDGHKLKARQRVSLSTVSVDLAYQIGFILRKLHKRPSINFEKEKRYSVEYSLKNKLNRQLIYNGLVWYEIRSIRKNRKQNVYNLHIEGTNTYVANGLIVHNCIGHNHMLGCVHSMIYKINETTEKVEEFRQMMVDCGGYIGYKDSYAERLMLQPLKIGSPRIHLFVKRKGCGRNHLPEIVSKDIHVSL